MTDNIPELIAELRDTAVNGDLAQSDRHVVSDAADALEAQAKRITELEAGRQGPITDAQKHADDLLAYVDYCLGLPVSLISTYSPGKGSRPSFRTCSAWLSRALPW